MIEEPGNVSLEKSKAEFQEGRRGGVETNGGGNLEKPIDCIW